MANEDSTPGIWQDDSVVLMLAHIAFCTWAGPDDSDMPPGTKIVEREKADRLLVYFISKDTLRIGPTSGDSLVRALNLYWETRTLSPDRPSETRSSTSAS